MSKSDTFENDWMKLIFNAVAITSLAANAGTPATRLSVSLHTTDPGEAGTQDTNEAAYTGYARISLPRDTGGFTVTNNQAVNATAGVFPQCTSQVSNVSYFAVGTTTSGAGKILYSGPLTATLTVSAGITPSFAAGALTVTED